MPASSSRPAAAGRALALGAASGMRTFAAPTVLALRGRWGRGRIGRIVPLVGAGELVADKTPFIPPRSGAPFLLGRIASGAAVGAAVGGGRGAGAGAAGAAATTYASQQLRALATQRSGLPPAVVAVAEDAVAIGVAAAASAGVTGGDAPSEGAPEPPPRAAPLAAAARGLAAAAIGTLAMTSVQTAYLTATGASASDTPERAGRRIIEGVFRRRVPRRQGDTVNMATHLLYGTAWGVPLGLIAGSLPHRLPASALGAATGLAVWGAGLAGLPAARLAPPPWDQPPAALGVDLAMHLAYGGATGAAYRALGG